MIKKKLNIGDLFYNNRFLLVFSVCLAVAIWLIVAVEFSPETKVVIKNVPIRVVATGLDKESELRPYGADNLTADITIVGKRYIVEDDKIINDLDVVANSGYVNGSGTHRLTVDVGSVSTRPQYEIVSCSVSEIEVMYDYEDVRQVPLKSEISIEKGKLAADGYFASEFSTSPQLVTVYGPRSEVELINSVSVVGIVEGGFTTSGTTDEVTLSMVLPNKAEPKYSKIKVGGNDASGKVTVGYSIYKEADKVTPDVEFHKNNIPYPEEQRTFDYEVILPEGTVFGFKDGNATEKIYVAEINVNNIEFNADGVYTTTVSYKGQGDVAVKNGDMKGSVDVTIKITDNGTAIRPVPIKPNGLYEVIEPLNPADNFEYRIMSVSNNVDTVLVKGPKETVSLLDADCLRLDFSVVPAGTTGRVNVPLKLDSQYSDCWISNVNENEILVAVEITGIKNQ